MRKELARDAQIAAIAARQHGVATAAQLATCGVSPAGITRRVRAGRLHRVYRGVYAVGHRALSNEGRWMAAVLAGGEGSTLSHRSAAELWRLLDLKPGSIHVTVNSHGGRARRHGLTIHRSPSLPTALTTLRDRIRVTTVPRTLSDLRGSVPAWELRRAIRQAEYLGLPTGLGSDGTRSDPESDFLKLCRRHRIPKPEINQRLGRFTVDFLWRAEKLVVETDAWTTHRGAQAFEDDHQRDLELAAMGFRVLRFTAAQVRDQAASVAAAVRSELGLASSFR